MRNFYFLISGFILSIANCYAVNLSYETCKECTSCGTNCKYTLNDGKLTIYGPSTNAQNGTIKNDIFRGNTSFTNIEIKGNIETIGGGAFAGTKIEDITIPDSVKTIGDGAFSRSGLIKISIPDSVTSVGSRAFYDMPNLEEVYVGNGSIGNDAFFSCDKLKKVVLSDKVTTVGDRAFVSPIETLVIGDQTTSGVQSFWYMSPNVKIYCSGEYEKCYEHLASTKYVTTNTQKEYGMTYIYDENGTLIAKYGKEHKPKRIYTVEEAAAVSKPMGNTFRLRYK
ncbi:MAG: leucine-rich repeat domain-containing protein [Alphaproteobacteria bacterium]|nr:leucine-rich repeat domain-containing protein [Alphaproteobacteria bacterium]